MLSGGKVRLSTENTASDKNRLDFQNNDKEYNSHT